MKKAFKLEKVLDFRMRKLDAEKAKLRELLERERRALERMAETVKLIKDKENEMDEDSRKGIFDFSSLYIKFIALKEEELQGLEAVRSDLAKHIDAQKIVLSKSLNDVKIMEKLKEKHLLSYAEYLKKLEEHNIDEINITRRKDEERL